MIDALETLLNGQAKTLIAGSTSAVAQALAEAEDNKLTVSVSVKLTLVNGRLYASGSIGFARKYKDEYESNADVDDPNAPRLQMEGEA